MELLLGSHVLEHGNRAGRLAGFELEPAERRVTRIIFSPDGELGPQAVTRPLSAITDVRGSTITVATAADAAPLPDAQEVLLLSRATRIMTGKRDQGRLTGITVDASDRRLLSVSGRAHWWSRRVTMSAKDLDCSTPGEIRSRASGDTRAA